MTRRDTAGVALDRFVDRLVAARIGTTFNQYRETGADDASPDAPAIRTANLRHYLASRAQAPVVAVAEAAGYRGARYSGITLYCERQIDEARTPLRRTSRHPGGWSEPSATIIQGILRDTGHADDVLLWNVVPTHPAGARGPHSNRMPTRPEQAAGAAFAHELIDIVGPAHVVAIGRTAAAALGDAVPVVRHPANGGATRCRSELAELLRAWLG